MVVDIYGTVAKSFINIYESINTILFLIFIIGALILFFKDAIGEQFDFTKKKRNKLRQMGISFILPPIFLTIIYIICLLVN